LSVTKWLLKYVHNTNVGAAIKNLIFIVIKKQNMTNNPLRKSNDRMIAGVCGGLANWFGWDPTVVRVAYVLLSVLSAGFPGLLVYIILAIVMPNENNLLQS
jgi:phage shock protein C